MPLKSTKRSNVLLTLGVLFTLGAATRLVPTNVAEAKAAESERSVEAVDAELAAAETKKKPLPVEGQVCFSEDLSGGIRLNPEKIGARLGIRYAVVH